MAVENVRLKRAAERAARLYPRSAGFQSAYVKGADAALKGRNASHCPYRADSRGTWRRSYRIAWMRGHRSLWEGEE